MRAPPRHIPMGKIEGDGAGPCVCTRGFARGSQLVAAAFGGMAVEGLVPVRLRVFVVNTIQGEKKREQYRRSSGAPRQFLDGNAPRT